MVDRFTFHFLPAASRLAASIACVSSAFAATDFVRDIQPVFQKHCYQCHGPERQEAAFRLDHKPSALKGGDLGVAIVPGKAEDSLLIRAVSGKEPKLKMPRKGEPLSEEQIGKLTAWINEGAVWPDSASAVIEKGKDHWAFKPPVKAAVPKISDFKFQISDWDQSKNPIDAFVAQRLAKEGLKPSPQAAPETLVRRLYLDITGLPPTPGEVDAFVKAWNGADATHSSPQSHDSYSRAVEKLLSSPHYGERWGRHWLDAARYADSNGYEKDPMRFIWFYRDWVINAFNRDLPYDQFIIEQLAGDLLPNATQDQIVATGFLRNSMVNEEGGVDPEQFRMESMFDRMDAIGKSILGLTINCCQCHNHKYDPISQEEYYRMFAYLNNDNEPWRVVYTPSEQMQRAQVRKGVTDLEAKLKHEHADWKPRMDAWAADEKKKAAGWQVLQAPFIDDTTGGQKMLMQKDGSYLAQSYAPTKSTPKFEIEVRDATSRSRDIPVPSNALDAPDAKSDRRDRNVPAPWSVVSLDTPISAFRLELLNDPNLPAYGPGRSQKGTCALTEFEVSAEIDGKNVPLKFASATADFGEPENTLLVGYARDKEIDKDKRVTGPISYAIDGNDKTAWGIDAGPGRRNVPRNAVFVLDKPLTKATKLTIGLAMKHGGWNSDDLQTMNIGRFRISCTTKANPVATHPATFASFRATVPEWKSVNDEIDALWKQHPEGTTTLVLDQRDEPRMTSVLKRGDFLRPGDAVQTGVPAMLNPLPKNADSSRLTFARWIADRQSPTTARALVNRVWQSYFGTGLVNTPEDLGTQGEVPMHRELLDWLACEFMERGWSMKELHRLIVTSQTYQQDSRITPALLEKDPYNRLLARGPRFRVEGEVVRDIQLAVSGLLNPKVGGRAVMPPAPAYLFEKPASYAPFPWKAEEDDEQYRRAVYVFRRRSTPYPFLSTFDVPPGETSCVRRAKSNTPLQALMTLNETMSMAAADALAQRMIKEGGSEPTQRIAHGFKLCTARAPSAKESAALLDLFKRQQQRNQADKTTADAYAVVARVMLNLDETITKE